jgi:HEPN domain-containing protein
MKIEQAMRHRRYAKDLYQREDYFDSLTHLHKAVKVFKVS